MSQQSILEQLPTAIAKAESLPSPPAVAVEVLRVTNDEDASIEDLAEIIRKRVRSMFDGGLLTEVSRLIQGGYRECDPGMRGIGYREFFAMLRNGCDTLKTVEEQICRNTRRYAKRQMTFFRSFPDVIWINAEDIDSVTGIIRRFMGSEGR